MLLRAVSIGALREGLVQLKGVQEEWGSGGPNGAYRPRGAGRVWPPQGLVPNGVHQQSAEFVVV